MKCHRFRSILVTGLLALIAACGPLPNKKTQPEPFPVHSTPVQQTINLTPTREGDVISAFGDGSGYVDGFSAASADQAPPMVEKTVRVGLLLPLTGRSAELGKAMQDAATISLFDKYARLSSAQQLVRLELIPKDTGDTPEQARAAMKEVLDQGVEMVIGPVFGNATQAAAPLATAKHIATISFTNNRAQASPGVYAFGFSPEEQANRVVQYAYQAGKNRIATLLPQTALGDLVAKAARDGAAASNSTLVAEARYSPEGTGLENALEKLIPAGSVRPPFDALLLAESGPTLATIQRALASRGVDRGTVQLLGTGLWDDASLLQQANLEGAWLASSPPQTTAQFEQRFLATYKYVPPRIASLAYDAVALAVTLATSNRPFDQKNLTQSAGYAGPANGVFRLRANGAVERGLAVLRVDGSSLSVISPAPAGFTSSAAQQ